MYLWNGWTPIYDKETLSWGINHWQSNQRQASYIAIKTNIFTSPPPPSCFPHSHGTTRSGQNNDNEDNKKHKGPARHTQDNNAKIPVPVPWMHIWNRKRQRWTRCLVAIGPLNWHTHCFTGERCMGSRQSRKGPTTHSICCGIQRGMVIFSNSRVTDKDRVVQLLECCDKQLRKT